MVNNLDGLKNAVEFYDNVQSSSEEDRAAVGMDHIDLLLYEARKLIRQDLNNTKLTTNREILDS
jgi:hypothetical protein